MDISKTVFIKLLEKVCSIKPRNLKYLARHVKVDSQSQVLKTHGLSQNRDVTVTRWVDLATKEKHCFSNTQQFIQNGKIYKYHNTDLDADHFKQ